VASEETLNLLRRYLARLKSERMPVEGIVLYGSHARDEAHEHSDIDVMVLLDDTVPRDELRSLWTQLDVLACHIDTRIETWPVHATRFETDEVSPLILIARQEGIPIAA